jgi:ABC-2 type transport system permease protein
MHVSRVMAAMMMRNVFTKSLYDMRWTILAFCVGLGALAFFILLIYPAVATAQDEMLGGLSEELARAMLGGMHLIGTPEGYLNIQLFSFHPLYISIFLIIVTSAAVAGEDSNKTLGVLLARPVSRWRVLLDKAAAITLGLVLITATITAGAVIGGLLAGVEVSYSDLVLSLVYTVPYGIWLIGFGLFCSALFKSRMVAALVATFVVVFGYMLNSLTELVEGLREYNYASPIYYYAWAEPLVRTPNYEHMLILLGTGLLFFIGAMIAFERREVHG